jgi:hypothetical protein
VGFDSIRRFSEIWTEDRGSEKRPIFFHCKLPVSLIRSFTNVYYMIIQNKNNTTLKVLATPLLMVCDVSNSGKHE